MELEPQIMEIKNYVAAIEDENQTLKKRLAEFEDSEIIEKKVREELDNYQLEETKKAILNSSPHVSKVATWVKQYGLRLGHNVLIKAWKISEGMLVREMAKLCEQDFELVKSFYNQYYIFDWLLSKLSENTWFRCITEIENFNHEQHFQLFADKKNIAQRIFDYVVAKKIVLKITTLYARGTIYTLEQIFELMKLNLITAIGKSYVTEKLANLFWDNREHKQIENMMRLAYIWHPYSETEPFMFKLAYLWPELILKAAKVFNTTHCWSNSQITARIAYVILHRRPTYDVHLLQLLHLPGPQWEFLAMYYPNQKLAECQIAGLKELKKYLKEKDEALVEAQAKKQTETQAEIQQKLDLDKKQIKQENQEKQLETCLAECNIRDENQ